MTRGKWLVVVLLHYFTGCLVRAKTIRSKPIRPLHHSSRLGNPLSVEQDFKTRQNTIILGSDESGTGALAGPLVTATVTCLDPTAPPALLPAVVRDGKTLTTEERQEIYNQVMKHPLYHCTIAMRTAQEIDQAQNLQHAVYEAFGESVEAMLDYLSSKQHDVSASQQDFLSIVDGKASIPNLTIPSRPWIKGDTTVYTIALASIVARVTRDEWIKNEAVAQYPQYDFDQHGGYPSRDHWHALHTHGPTPIHRQSCKIVRQRNGIPPDGATTNTLTRSDLLQGAFWVATASATTTDATMASRPARAIYTDKKTGIQFPEAGEIEAAIPLGGYDPNDIAEFLAGDKARFQRLDSSNDAIFYQDARFVEHVDQGTVQRMTDYLNRVLVRPSQVRTVLDLCSSWTSHLPDCAQHGLERVVGLGMNAQELRANPSLTEWVVSDLNEKPVLPYADESFDAVVCQLSIDYLTKPVPVCREIGRVLRKGGTVHILFSNRLFIQKAVASWTGADDVDHAYTVGLYLQAAGNSLGHIKALDLSERKGVKIVGDPLYVVTAMRVS